MNAEIEVVLESANGPKVIAGPDVAVEEILRALPAGWTVHEDDWSNQVKLSDGRLAYPLSHAAGTP